MFPGTYKASLHVTYISSLYIDIIFVSYGTVTCIGTKAAYQVYHKSSFLSIRIENSCLRWFYFESTQNNLYIRKI
jgi:hypothetical protein